MDTPAARTPVHRAGWQGRKVAGLWVLFLVATLACAALAVWAETPTNRATGAILGACMALFAVGMEVYRRAYVVALDVADDGRVRICTARFGWPHASEHDAGGLTAGEAHAGAWRGNGMSGAAPWIALRAPGRRLPFLLDLQGEVLDGAALARLTGQRWMADLERLRPPNRQ